MLIFEIFLPVREPLVATFKETRAVTSPKDIVKHDMKIPKAWEKHKLLWYFSPVFARKIASKILTFAGFLPLKWQIVAAFSETSAVTSKKDIVKQGMNNSKSFKNYEL